MEVKFKKCVATIDGADGNRLNVGNYFIYNSNASEGFNFGYMLYIPNDVRRDSSLIVEGANTGISAETIEQGIQDVQDTIFNFSTIGQHLAYKLQLPFMMPLFPRVAIKNHELYTHMLTSEVLSIKDGQFKRIDIQLINMIKNVRQRLFEMNIKTDEKVILNGFSASAKFVNRFLLLHPEMVKLCLSGGVGGCLTLPIKQIKDEILRFPIGMGNIPEFNDEAFNLFKEVSQFYYMGSLDDNDVYAHSDNDVLKPKYESAITKEELKQLYNILGMCMQKDRWSNTQEIYHGLGINAEFKTYDGYGHTSKPAQADLVSIIQEKLELDKNNTTKS